MKKLLIALTCIAAQNSLAQMCKSESAEMAQFFSQQHWSPSVIQGEGVPAVQGFVDPQNKFHLQEMSRKGNFQAKLSIPKNNKSFKQFFKYCRRFEDWGEYLSSMREDNEANTYLVQLRYLPDSAVLKESLARQTVSVSDFKIKPKFDSKSLIENANGEPGEMKKKFYANLQKQLKSQNVFGVINLDLTGWDDAVCDLIQGKIQLGISQSMQLKSALVTQRKVVESQDVSLIYSTLKQKIPRSLAKEPSLFRAGLWFAKLVEQRQIAPLDENMGFRMLGKMMDSALTKVADLQHEALQCVADQMQAYSQPLEPQYFDLSFSFRSLDEIEAEARGQNE